MVPLTLKVYKSAMHEIRKVSASSLEFVNPLFEATEFHLKRTFFEYLKKV